MGLALIGINQPNTFQIIERVNFKYDFKRKESLSIC